MLVCRYVCRNMSYMIWEPKLLGQHFVPPVKLQNPALTHLDPVGGDLFCITYFYVLLKLILSSTTWKFDFLVVQQHLRVPPPQLFIKAAPCRWAGKA